MSATGNGGGNVSGRGVRGTGSGSGGGSGSSSGGGMSGTAILTFPQFLLFLQRMAPLIRGPDSGLGPGSDRRIGKGIKKGIEIEGGNGKESVRSRTDSASAGIRTTTSFQ